jgi:hypothetical protein
MLRSVIEAGVRAARTTGGVVDPTLGARSSKLDMTATWRTRGCRCGPRWRLARSALRPARARRHRGARLRLTGARERCRARPVSSSMREELRSECSPTSSQRCSPETTRSSSIARGTSASAGAQRSRERSTSPARSTTAAFAPTAAEAEVLSKAAVLSGPQAAGKWLTDGGLVVLDDGNYAVTPTRVASHAHMSSSTRLCSGSFRISW